MPDDREKIWDPKQHSDNHLEERLQLCRKPEGDAGITLAHEMNQTHSELVRWALDLYSDEVGKGRNALDIGCGGGATLEALHTRYPALKLSGIDYSPDMVRLSSEKLSGIADIIHGSVTDLPYKSGEFDLITAVETTYFWPELNKSFQNVHNILQETGRFIIIQEMYDDRENDLFTQRNQRILSLSKMQVFTPEGLQEILLTAGFSRVDYNTLPEKNWITYLIRK